ncbi:TPA: TRAP transporter large permease [Clostridium perfringens]|uniref:TRAP transporter large permease n=1 Tax=Clostridium TaxID=1485 RepID=UPI00115C2902|nr:MULTISPECIES: TRAP transporter large permease [Clostridium]EHK2362641.1 TRAP transporter large permease [Clostridium perfringens]EJT5929270.1 TRAP transporter large permease [Clostridium perfringens]EJT6484039.1 TRAP transporter large permease [Clostridium perfringens]MDK0955546.1 TRAP transporter large permease [Clostridium perfringens]MDM0910625.1 TRAP transporter large permease [Clostridium perfringens]
MELAFQAGTAIAIVFPILLLLGIPISITIGISSIFGILTTLSWDVAVLTGAQRIFTGISSFSLLAIPFFVLAGTIMNSGGIALRLVNFAKVLSGKLPGSLAHTNVVGNMLFGAVSGSSVAAAAAIGGTMAPLQKAEGYDKNYSAAVNIASAPTGLLIPPSNSLIIYSLVSGGTSVAALFMAGYIPGILWGLSVMVVAFILAKKYKYSSKYTITFKEAIKIFIDALPSLALIFIIIGGIVGGVFTATEGAAVAVVYSFILSFFFYNSIKLKDIPRILLETVEMTGIIIFLIGVSSIMSWVMAFTNIPNAITELLLGISSNPIVILLIMNLVLLIVGTFMDLTPAILIFTPIFLPIAKNFGMDSVQFGIMLIFNLCIGNITPPVGNTLFIGCKVGKTSIEEVIKYLLPFYGGILVVLMLVTFIPEISLFIPKLMGMI